MSDVQLTVVEGDVAQVIGAIPGPQGPAGAVAAAIDGSAALPSIAFASDTDTGLYRVGANQLGVSTGGTGRLFVDASGNVTIDTNTFYVDATNNRVGIGTTSPTSALEINGTITIGTGGTQIYQAGVIGYTDNNWGCLNRPPRAGAIGAYGFQSFAGTTRMQISDTGTTTLTSATSTAPVIVNIGVSEVARIDSSGRLGIGTVSPADALHVNGGYIRIQRDTPQIFFRSADGASNQYYIGANISDAVDGGFVIGEGANISSGTPRITINGAGNVGIGTASPSSLLSLAASNTDTVNYYSGPRVAIANTSATANNFAGVAFQSAAGNDAAAIWSVISSHTAGSATASLVFGTSNASGASSERMRITSTGNVGIGTVSPGAVLHSVAAVAGGNPSTSGTADANVAARFQAASVNLDVGVQASGHIWMQPRLASNFASNFNLLLCPNGGLVGIGTASPEYKLDVLPDAGGAALRVRGGSGGSSIVQFTDNAVSAQWGNVTTTSSSLNILHSGVLQFSPGGSEKARIRSDGLFEVKGAGTAGVSPAFSVSGSAPANSAIVDSSGRLLLGTSTNTGGSLFQVNDNRIRIATAKTPASATDTGSAGEICWDANYIYVCTATNTWKRTAISTW